ncbi:glycoside hydrolase family 18 protein [Micromonospora sp. NPDC049559]|uniref:glycoside hydrolase family 18 protein n=1 Tax=Micromonospora sp. NPDC049559 TaxID=3155923 RepID=UPI003416AD00
MRYRSARTFAALAATVAVLLTAAPATGASAQPGPAGHGTSLRKVGYFTQWGIYARAFTVKKLETSGAADQLTHVNYAFGNVSADGRCYLDGGPGEGDPWADYQRPVPAEESVDGVADQPGQALAGNFHQLAKLKARHPDLKVLISLGGWSWSTYFSNAALTDASRKAFVASCIDLYLRGNLPAAGGSGGPGAAAGVFDGIDLDWEWPNWPGDVDNVTREADRENFTKLLAEFRRQLDAYGRQARRHYELTAFLPANPAAMDAGYEGRKIFKYLDFATVQGYDFHGGWDAVTNQQSALRVPAGAPDDPDFSVEVAVGGWLDRGAPRDKLVLGIPYYGRGWTGVTGGGNGLFRPAAAPAPATYEAGYEDYKLLKELPGKGFTLHRDLRAGHAWLFDGTTLWTYDDPVVVLQKALWIRQQRLGGAMIWSLDGDDDNATLSRTIGLGLRTR